MRSILRRDVKILKWTLPLWVLIGTGLLSSGALALWIYGMSISGLFTATSGTYEVTEFNWDISVLNDGNVSKYFIYANPDGVRSISLSLDDSAIVSSNGNCTYEHGKDFKMYITDQTTEYELTDSSWSTTLVTGDTNYTLTVVPHTNRCPLTGTYSVDMDFV